MRLSELQKKIVRIKPNRYEYPKDAYQPRVVRERRAIHRRRRRGLIGKTVATVLTWLFIGGLLWGGFRYIEFDLVTELDGSKVLEIDVFDMEFEIRLGGSGED